MQWKTLTTSSSGFIALFVRNHPIPPIKNIDIGTKKRFKNTSLYPAYLILARSIRITVARKINQMASFVLRATPLSSQHIAGATDSMYKPLWFFPVYLITKVGNIDINDICLRIKINIPYMFCYHTTG